MQQDILIAGVLFPAIPLSMINFGNRYSILASLIRSLHDQIITIGQDDETARRLLLQLASLRRRVVLIRFTQSCAGFSFLLNLIAIMALYFDNNVAGSWLFFSAIVLLMMSMLMFLIEIQVSTAALDMHLSDLEAFRDAGLFRRRRRAKPDAKVKPAIKPIDNKPPENGL